MNTPMGKSNELPDHFKEGPNEKALIKYENCDEYLCFWRCLAYRQTKPEDPRNINKRTKYLFNDYYKKEKEIKYFCGVEFVVCNKECTRLPGRTRLAARPDTSGLHSTTHTRVPHPGNIGHESSDRLARWQRGSSSQGPLTCGRRPCIGTPSNAPIRLESRGTVPAAEQHPHSCGHSDSLPVGTGSEII